VPNLTKDEYLYKNGGRFEIKFITERIQSRVTNPRQPLWLSKTRTSSGRTDGHGDMQTNSPPEGYMHIITTDQETVTMYNNNSYFIFKNFKNNSKDQSSKEKK
jgi:hypothetical protein